MTYEKDNGLAHKVLKGGLALGARQILVQLANVLGGILLSRMLLPAQFGVFAVITFFMVFLSTFSGTGLGANLIRQEADPTTEDYQALFSFQIVLILGIAVVLAFLSTWIAGIYNLPRNGAWIFVLIALAFIASGLMVIPQIKLERKLEFTSLAPIEIAQAWVFNGSAVFLAWLGYGGYAFAYALVLRYLVGAILVNRREPWSWGWRWDYGRVRKHLQFGMYYQGSQLISVIKDSVNPVFIGMLLGTADVGYLNWAGMVAAYPVLMLMALRRLYLPMFSKAQARKPELSNLLENILWTTNAIAAPFAVFSLVFITSITKMIFGSQWLHAIPMFYLLWIANLIVPTITPLMGVMDALGYSRFTMRVSFMWAFATWVFSVPLVFAFGAIGFAIANVGVQLTNLGVVRLVRKEICFRWVNNILPTWLIAFMGIIPLEIIKNYWPVTGIVSLMFYAICFLVIYTMVVFFLFVNQRNFLIRYLRKSNEC